MTENVSMLLIDTITRKEAETIAKEIDPQASDYFLRCMMQAAQRGATHAITKHRRIEHMKEKR